MKKVFSSHDEVVHVFAQRTQNEGRACNIFFEGDKIYSYGYHYELARFENNHIVINDLGYSVSTAKHIGIVRSATSHYKQYFETLINPKLILSEIKEAWSKLRKAKKPELYYKSDFLAGFKAYLEEFTKEEQKIKVNRFALELKEIKSIQRQMDNLFNSDNIKEKIALNIKRDKELKKEKLRKDLERFYNFKTDHIRTGDNLAYLRLSETAEHVETSKGVKIEVSKALTLFKMIEAGKDIKGYKLDYYTVISMNGVLKVGCHEIPKSEVFRMGKILKAL